MWKRREPERTSLAGAMNPPPPAWSCRAELLPIPQNFRERPEGSPNTIPMLTPEEGVVVKAEMRTANIRLF